ncbi:hypothetical protein FXW78_22480 [Rhodococcus opacus]|nr:hypothetical protein [Rhodococcus opacus]
MPPAHRNGNRDARQYHPRADAPTRSQDLDWVRHALHVCDLLASVHSLSPSDRALLAFAIQWAPYGGADPEELFITFGVPRTKFLHMLGAAMTPRPTDLQQLRAIKTSLHNDLLRARQTHQHKRGKRAPKPGQ